MHAALHGGVAAIALCASGVVLAEVATDGTMGARARLTGRDVTIGADLGTIRGRNLFHSFERFDIETGGSATFTGPGGLDRVISRVTGGKASNIDGTLRSTVPGADVYLVNPSGILFGPNARLDVPASFHASTADELRFPGGGVFSASDPSRTVLSVAAPEAFGFLGARPASITLSQGRLEVGTGKSLSLVGGAITVSGTGVLGVGGVVRAPGGELTLASLGGKGAVTLGTHAEFFDPVEDRAFRPSDIVLGAGALISTSGDGGGRLRMRSGRVTLNDNAAVQATNIGATDASGGIAVRAEKVDVLAGSFFLVTLIDSGAAGSVTIDAGRVAIDGAGSGSPTGIFAQANAGSSGAAGVVTLNVEGTLDIRGGGKIVSDTLAAGNAGAVTVRAGKLLLKGAGDSLPSVISSDAQNGSTGNAGAVTISTSGFLRMANNAAIASSTNADGRAGPVTITTGGLLNIEDGSVIASGTSAAGDAGQVTIAARRIDIDGSGRFGFAGVVSQARQGSTGNAGKVTIAARGRLHILDGGLISSETLAGGDAGFVSVRAGRLTLDGAGTDRFTAISSDAAEGSSGAAGEVDVIADGRLEVRRGALITSTTFAVGDAGRVTVTAESVTIDRAGSAFPTGIVSDAEVGSTGAAAEVTVTVAKRLALLAGGGITSSTFGPGDAGRVTIDAGTILIDGSGTNFATFVSSDALQGASGDAGDVTVTARGAILLRNGGSITSDTLAAAGDAGLVTVQAGRLTINGSGANPLAFTGISSESRFGSTGAAGSVTVRGETSIELLERGEIGSSSDGVGAAGDVVVEASEVRLEDARIRTVASGTVGGRVTVSAERQVTLVDSEISTNGTLPTADTSVMALAAPTVLLSDSRVTALTGNGQPLTGSGVVDIDARRTLISRDSRVLGSSAVNITGVVNNLLAPTRPAPPAPTDPSRLLRDCAEERLGGRGSFKATGRGGLPASPEEFLTGRPVKGSGKPARLASAGCTSD